MTPEALRILLGYIIATVYVVLVVGVSLVFYKFGLPKNYTRKIVHILVGAEWIILSELMGATYHFLIVCLAFTAILALSFFKKLLPAMSSDGENDPGTVYYGVSMSIMALITLFVGEMMVPFGIGVFCTSLGDGLAGVVGQLVKKNNPKIYRNKSLVGTLTNFVVSFGVALVFDAVYALPLTLWHCFFIGVFSAGLELIGSYGLDNLYITIGIALLSYAFMTTSEIMLYVLPIVTAPFIAAAVIQKRALTGYGLIMAMILDFIVSVVFQNFGFLVMISFFVGAMIVDKIKRKKKYEDTITKKEGTRDLIQVLANGLTPLVMAVLYAYTLHIAFLIAYVAAFAEAFADTVASGLGVFSKRTFDVFKMRRCECGMSGGMSLIGTVSALVASVLLSLYLGLFNWWFVLISSSTAFLGVIFDSLLGSLVQIKFRCSECGKLTERHVHCDKPTTQVAGFAFFDNDVVNLLSGVFTAVLTVVICVILF